MSKSLNYELPDQEQACSDCGLTRTELYAQGTMGCVSCYQTFSAEVERALEEIHGAVEHTGKS
jgi:protein arginine kinase activator